MNTRSAFIAGVVAAAIASGVMLLLRLVGLPLDVLTRMGGVIGLSTWVVGLVLYLLVGGIVALIYAAVFEWVLSQGGVGAGLVLGAFNAIIAGFIWSPGSDPGRFWEHFGVAGIAALFLVHFVYGGIVGGMYRANHTPVYG